MLYLYSIRYQNLKKTKPYFSSARFLFSLFFDIQMCQPTASNVIADKQRRMFCIRDIIFHVPQILRNLMLLCCQSKSMCGFYSYYIPRMFSLLLCHLLNYISSNFGLSWERKINLDCLEMQ